MSYSTQKTVLSGWISTAQTKPKKKRIIRYYRSNPKRRTGFFAIPNNVIIEHIFKFFSIYDVFTILFLVCKTFKILSFESLKNRKEFDYDQCLYYLKYLPTCELFEYFYEFSVMDVSLYKTGFFMYSCKKGYCELAKTILREHPLEVSENEEEEEREGGGVDPSDWDNYAIRHASRNGHADIVQFLLDLPQVNPSVKENAPIYLACLHGRTDVVDVLLNDERVDPSDKGNVCLKEASRFGFIEIVRLLLQNEEVLSKDTEKAMTIAKERYRKTKESVYLKIIKLIKITLRDFEHGLLDY